MISSSLIAMMTLKRAWRELIALVRYSLVKSTAGDRLGVLWWFLEPIVFAAIFYFVVVLVFSRGGPDYHFYLVSGLFAWQIFANTLTSTAGALSSGGGLLKQGAIKPLVTVVAPFFLGIFRGSLAMLLIMPIFPYEFGWNLLLLFPAIVLQSALACAIGMPLAPLVAIVPDIRRLLAFVVRVGWFMTPVLYPLSRITESDRFPDWAETLYLSNPVVHTISFFRLAFEGQSPVALSNYYIIGGGVFLGLFLSLGFVFRMQNIAMKYL